MGKRLNDTRAIAKQAMPANPLYENETHSVHVRPIANGYLKTETHSDADGYSSNETFHRNKPDLNSPRMSARSGGGSETMKRAVAAAKKT